MKRCEWTILERSGRWAAALRLAIHRADWPASAVPRLVEVRRLDELNGRLATHSNGLFLVEVHRANFADVLHWFAAAAHQHSHARCVALVGGDISSNVERDAAADALREAGASEVVHSPRRLHRVLMLGRRHAALQRLSPDSPLVDMSLMDWAWSSLPWQDE